MAEEGANPKEKTLTQEMMLKILFESQGADALREQLNKLEKEAGQAGGAFDRFGTKLQNFGKVVGAVGAAVQGFTNVGNSIAGSFGATGVSFGNATKAALEYKSTIINTSAEFMRIGGSVRGYTANIERLRNQYYLTTDQASKLTTATSRMFVGMNIAEVNKQMDSLLRHFRGNAEAAMNFQQQMKGLTKNSIEAREALASNDFTKLMAIADALGDEEAYAEAATQAAMAAASPRDKATLDALNEPLKQNRAVTTKMEQANIELGNTLLDIRTNFINAAGGIDAFSTSLASATKSLAMVSGLFSVVGGVVSTFGGAIGGIGDALGGIKKFFGKKGGAAGKAAGALEKVAGKEIAEVAAKDAAKVAEKVVAKEVAEVGVKTAGKLLAKEGLAAGAKGLGKSLLKKIPGVGLAVAGGMAYDRYMGGDVLGAAGEALSGIASLIPGIGTAASLAIDAGLAARDIAKASAGAVPGEGANLGNINPIAAERKAAMMAKSGGATNISEAVVDPYVEKSNALKRSIEQANIGYQNQKNLVSSIVALSDKQSSIVAATGNYQKAQLLLNKEQKEMGDSRAKITALIAAKEEKLKYDVSQGKLEGDALKAKQTEINNLKAEALEIGNQILEKDKAAVNVYEQQISLLNATMGRMQAEMNLVDNMGMGLGASVAARQQMVEMLSKEAALQQKAAEEAESRMIAARKQAADTSLSEEQRAEAGRNAVEMEKLMEEKRTKTLEATSKAAELTKKMREGWIQSIAFMATGAGAFTRIVVSQNANLGILDKTRRDMVKTLTYGGVGDGRTESGRFTPGGYVEGAAGQYEKDILKLQGVSTEYSKIRENIQNTMDKQREAAKSGVGPAAAFGSGPGSGLGAIPIEGGATKIGSPSATSATSATPVGLPSGASATSGVSTASALASDQMQKFKDSLVEAFTQIIAEAKRDVLTNIKQAVN